MATANKPAMATPEGKNGRSSPRDQPGGLRGSMTMTIQTRLAQSLVGRRQGRHNPNDSQIIGLFAFGQRLKQIWLSAEANDPYADWYLLQIEEGLQQAKQQIGEQLEWLKNVMSGKDGFSINMAEANRPVEVPLAFQNPYGYLGAYLIHDYDVLARMVFTARHIGLLDSDTARKVMHEAGKGIRRSFGLSTHWKFTGVTRDDLVAGNLNAQRALAEFGECPVGVLSGAQRAKASPPIRRKSATITGAAPLGGPADAEADIAAMPALALG
jgi:integrating conjugative element protein (TIGR03761 family)